MSATRFEPSEATLTGVNADIYFKRTRQVLEAEEIDPVVAVEVFARAPAVLCGIREVHALLRRVLPEGAKVWSLEEGVRIDEREVVLRIRAPYASFCLYETAILGTLASETGWAAAAEKCVRAADGTPVIHFGARHVHPDVSGRLEYAACVGGCATCATSWGAELAGVDPSGTLPHGLILAMGDTLRAAEAFDRCIDKAVDRVVLVDTFMDEADESVRVADAMADRLWGVRLDTAAELGGVTVDLVNRVRGRLDDAGHSGVRIVVSGGLDVDRIRHFRGKGAAVDAFGVGSAISGAPPVDFTADIKEVNEQPLAKRGRSSGLTNNHKMGAVDLQ